jgi:YD repeat-containing protein
MQAGSSIQYTIYILNNGAVTPTDYLCEATIYKYQFGFWLPALVAAPYDVVQIGSVCPVTSVTDSYGNCGPKQQRNEFNCSNPILGAFGDKYQNEQDDASGQPIPVVLGRHYNHLVGDSNTMGIGWRNEYERKLVVDDIDYNTTNFDPTLLTLQRQDGTRYAFTFNGTTWVPDADVNFQVVRLSNALTGTTGWQVRTPDGSLETYAATGNLTAIYGKAGGVLTFGYDANLHLTSVTDTFSRIFSFGWDAAANRINSVTTPDAYAYGYAYDANGNLATVTYPNGTANGTTRTYYYNEAANTGNNAYPNFLTGIGDEDGNRYATFQYDATKKAIASLHAGGANLTSFTYNADGTVNIVDALGSNSKFTYATVNGTRLISGRTKPAGSGCPASSSAVTYDANGNAASRLDFNGNESCYAYDLTRNLETKRVEGLSSTAVCATVLTTPPAPTTANPVRVVSTQWHPNWRLEVRRAEPKKITTWVYNGQPDPTNANAILTCAPGTALLPTGNPIAVLCKQVEQATTDATGTAAFTATATGTPRTWTYTYNQYGQVLTANGPRTDVTDTTTYVYYPSTDPNGHWTLGDLQTVTNALNQVTQLTQYDKVGRPLTVIDANGVTTTLTYTPRGWLHTKSTNGETTTYTYDNVGQLIRIDLPDTSYLTYIYDAAHRLTEIHDALGNKIVYTLDAMGNRQQDNVYDPSGVVKRTHQRVFDALSRLWKDIGGADPTHQITQYGYDANGNRTTVTDPLANVTTNQYDALNRLVTTLQPIPATGQPQPTTSYAYDGQDRLSQVTDPRSLVTGYTVDGLGNATQLTSPDSGTSNSTYDEAGNLKTRTDAKGQTTTYTYDALNRVTQATFFDNSKQVFAYDLGSNGVGRLASISEYDINAVLTNKLEYSYDPLGRVTQDKESFAGAVATTQYLYDSGGRLSQITYPSGRLVDYTYDAAGHIQRIDTTTAGQPSPQMVVGTVQYQPFGEVTSYTYGNGQTHVRAFDADGRLGSYSLGASTYNVGYDYANQLKSITDAVNSAQTKQYGYDPLGRLTSATVPTANYGYTYDAVGNRLTRTGTAPSTLTYAATSNRMATNNGFATPFDANGSLTSTTAVSAFWYDTRGRMTFSIASGVQTNYQIDALGRRIRKTSPTADTRYSYDLAGHLIAESTPGGLVLKEYLYLGDLPVAVVAQ